MLFWLLFSSKSIQNILILSAIVAPFASAGIRPVVNRLNQDTTVYYGLVFCLFFWPYMVKWHNSGIINQSKAYFTSGILKNLKSTDVNKLINLCYKKILNDIDAYQENGSGWYFNEVVQLEIHTVEFNPAKGSSYIVLPEWIKNKKAIVTLHGNLMLKVKARSRHACTTRLACGTSRICAY